ncbi:rhodanese-like domain-containing protein [Parasphingorhabdus sp.]|uniref:rhodanese-like domain-containing protein n=1 Tax=Parasphingorhabdus sp. TaxID=2709688 RepID=UPI0032649A78
MHRRIVAAAIIAGLGSGAAQAETLQPETNPQIDYRGFAALTGELEGYRSERLVTLERFHELAQQPDAIILDTRSAAAFEMGHIAGAVNLPFSDFTDAKLVKVIGDKTRPILIYCNNNFSNNVRPIALKRTPLALNIPTFINLYGYGYQNIYELNDIVDITDPAVKWQGLDFSKILVRPQRAMRDPR